MTDHAADALRTLGLIDALRIWNRRLVDEGEVIDTIRTAFHAAAASPQYPDGVSRQLEKSLLAWHEHLVAPDWMDDLLELVCEIQTRGTDVEEWSETRYRAAVRNPGWGARLLELWHRALDEKPGEWPADHRGAWELGPIRRWVLPEAPRARELMERLRVLNIGSEQGRDLIRTMARWSDDEAGTLATAASRDADLSLLLSATLKTLDTAAVIELMNEAGRIAPPELDSDSAVSVMHMLIEASVRRLDHEVAALSRLLHGAFAAMRPTIQWSVQETTAGTPRQKPFVSRSAPQGILGRVALAELLAGETNNAMTTATLQLTKSGGWYTQGEDAVAVYVLQRSVATWSQKFELCLYLQNRELRHANLPKLQTRAWFELALAFHEANKPNAARAALDYAKRLEPRQDSPGELHIYPADDIDKMCVRIAVDPRETRQLEHTLRVARTRSPSELERSMVYQTNPSS